jgi:hypothetical protein
MLISKDVVGASRNSGFNDGTNAEDTARDEDKPYRNDEN